MTSKTPANTGIEEQQRQRLAAARAAVHDYHEKLGWPAPVTTPVVETIDGALVCPETRATRNDLGILVQDGSVTRPDGSFSDLALHRACNALHVNIPTPPPKTITPREVPGTHLFGGVLIGHFGHFLLECLSRLWALQTHGANIETVVFLRSRGLPTGPGGQVPHGQVPLPRYMQDTLALLGVRQLTIVHEAPVRFERLLVPSQLLGHHLIEGHEAFHSFARRLRAENPGDGIPPDGVIQPDGVILPDGIRGAYISRRKICEAGEGGLVCEHVIEENLRAYGYQTIYPEELTLAEQLGVYNACDRVVFATGSAVHLFALAARPGHKAFLINRKPRSGTLMLGQLRGFGCGQAEQFDGITARLFRPDAPTTWARERTSAAVLDFARLGDSLKAQGFLPDTRAWRAPTPQELSAHRAAIEAPGVSGS